MIISFNNLCILFELGRNFKHVPFTSIHNIKDLMDIADRGLEREKHLGAVVEKEWWLRERELKEESAVEAMRRRGRGGGSGL
ncbi:hypothetical protein Tco_0624635 [Tanacetum coccineum]|uniref:Uncharacterized protein n=1 Tax=Tanacetum coccineum TaxID=301880 RepID=A0ABQ4WEH5_9ASTR